MRNLLLASVFSVSAVALAFLPSAASAQSAAVAETATGAPSISDNSPAGWYVFRDNGDDGIHLRTHGPGAEHNFDATLRTRGTFENVDAVKLEDGDHVDVLDGGHALAIHLHTFDYTDGVNFTVRGGERLRLNLRLDGQAAPMSMIFLGDDGHHPAQNPFTLEV